MSVGPKVAEVIRLEKTDRAGSLVTGGLCDCVCGQGDWHWEIWVVGVDCRVYSKSFLVVLQYYS